MTRLTFQESMAPYIEHYRAEYGETRPELADEIAAIYSNPSIKFATKQRKVRRAIEAATGKVSSKSIREDIRESPEYAAWRDAVIAKEHGVCSCGARATDAHHKVMLVSIVSRYKVKTMERARKVALIWDVNNGIAVCQKCHRKAHSY